MSEATASGWSFKGVVAAVVAWIKANLPRAIMMSAISFVVGWFINVYVLASRYQGYAVPPGTKEIATGDGSMISGTIFWAALSTTAFALFSYSRRVGRQKVIEDIKSLPTTIKASLDGDQRDRTLATIAWASAISLLVAVLIGPGAAGVVAVALTIFATTPLGTLVAGVIRRLWVDVLYRLAPTAGQPLEGVPGAIAATAGTAAGMAIAYVFAGTTTKVVLALLAAGAAYMLVGREAPPSATTTVIALLGGVLFIEFFEAARAFADDGGWAECGNCNLIDWARSEGAVEVINRGVVGGAAAGAGAPVGSALGEILAGGGPPGGATPGAGAPGGDVLAGGGPSGGAGPGTAAPATGTGTAPAGAPDVGSGPTARGTDGRGDDGGAAQPRQAEAPDTPADGEAPSAPDPGILAGGGPSGGPGADGGAGAAGTQAPPADGPAAEGGDGAAGPADPGLLAGGGPSGGPGAGQVEEVGDDAEGGPEATLAPGDTTRRPTDAAEDAASEEGAEGTGGTEGTEGAEDAEDAEGAESTEPTEAEPTEPTEATETTEPTEAAEPTAGPVPAGEPAPEATVPPKPAGPPPSAVAAGVGAGATVAPAEPDAAGGDAPAEDPAPVPETESGGFLGTDVTGWLSDTAETLSGAKDQLEGWIDDIFSEDEAQGVKDTLGTEQIGDTLGTIKDAADTYEHFVDVGTETIDELEQLNVPPRMQEAVVWMRWMGEITGRGVQMLADNIVTPVIEPITTLFGGDAEEVAHTILPVQETAEEGSNALMQAVRNIRGGSQGLVNRQQNQDILGDLYEFP